MAIPAVGLQKAKAGRLDALRLDRRFAHRRLARRWTARGAAVRTAIPAVRLQKAVAIVQGAAATIHRVRDTVETLARHST